jgi:hypothetical protein
VERLWRSLKYEHVYLSRFREFRQRDEWKDCSSASH